jgi:catechol 2,3-dioxygenase-like lactoylglutathione lyase family enzyme
MSVPKTNRHPPFRFLRASHAIFTSRDLAKSREFYTEVLGLLVSNEDKDTLYLRGLEERAHHSLAIKRTQDEPACLRVGCVFTTRTTWSAPSTPSSITGCRAAGPTSPSRAALCTPST